MSNFKQATKERLRVQTSRGPLSVEELWDLPLEELDSLAVSLEEEHKNSKGKSFLTKTSVKDKTVKLRFDIVLEILNTKVEERDAALQKKDDREHNEEIMRLIKQKEKGELEGKSIAELTAMLR